MQPAPLKMQVGPRIGKEEGAETQIATTITSLKMAPLVAKMKKIGAVDKEVESSS